VYITDSSALEYHQNPVVFLEEQKPLVIYNRVPKTGSTSFVNVAYDLHSHNAFRVLHVNVTGNSHLLSIYDQVSIALLYLYSRNPAITISNLEFKLTIIICFSSGLLTILHVGCDPHFIMVILRTLILRGNF